MLTDTSFHVRGYVWLGVWYVQRIRHTRTCSDTPSSTRALLASTLILTMTLTPGTSYSASTRSTSSTRSRLSKWSPTGAWSSTNEKSYQKKTKIFRHALLLMDQAATVRRSMPALLLKDQTTTVRHLHHSFPRGRVLYTNSLACIPLSFFGVSEIEVR